MPGRSLTITLFSFKREFIKEDFPTLGFPIKLLFSYNIFIPTIEIWIGFCLKKFSVEIPGFVATPDDIIFCSGSTSLSESKSLFSSGFLLKLSNSFSHNAKLNSFFH